jgi:hydroxymethylbilane synthase
VGATTPSWPVDRPFRLATRGSPLALLQAASVADLLGGSVPGIEVELVVLQTSGDQRADLPLDRIGGQGVFVKEIQRAVLDGRADAAVHSAKDLPSTGPHGLTIAAVPLRADPRDALVGHRLDALPTAAVVATGSARRRAQLVNIRPDLVFTTLRGNMEARVRRGEDGSVGAVIVAVAAMERLGWFDRVTEVLPVTVMLPQVGQGALALECRSDDRGALAALGTIDHRASRRAVEAERAFLAAVGGSCTLPIGAWAVAADDRVHGGDGVLRLRAVLGSADGRVVVRADRFGDDPAGLGGLVATDILDGAGGASFEGWSPTPPLSGSVPDR